MTMTDSTYCASPCRNYDCPQHQTNAPDDYHVRYALLAPGCPKFMPFTTPEEPDGD